jgi:hypothetical protein
MSHQKSNSYAPILVIVHTRFNHFKKCIESLLSNPEAKFSDIYISSDSYRNDEEKIKVEEIRNYVKHLKGFKSVNPIFFEKNLGSEFTGNFSFNKVFNKNDSIIFLEDDNEVSPLFLEYINKGLKFYENDPNVFSICGFSPQIFNKSYNSKAPESIYSSIRWAPWGFGITKSKFIDYENFRNNEDTLLMLKNDLKNNDFCNKLKSMGLDLYNHLLYCSKSNYMFEYDHGVAYYCLKMNYRSIYSYHSLTKNTGNDGSGQRSLNNNTLSNYFNFNFKNIEVNFEDFYKIESIDNLWYNLHYNFKEKTKTILISIGLFDQIKKIHRKIKTL